jgi:hypothetical protein
MQVYPRGLREWIATPLVAGSNPVTCSKFYLNVKGMSDMQTKSSKLQSEMVIGRYIDIPIRKAKKVDKQLIKRTRRSIEKREALQEINEALLQM